MKKKTHAALALVLILALVPTAGIPGLAEKPPYVCNCETPSLSFRQVVTLATCTSGGVGYYECGTCGGYIDDNVPPDPNAHDFSRFVETVAANCAERGYDIYGCSRCTATEKRNSTALNPDAHDFSVLVETVAATCTGEGYKLYKCSRCTATEKRDRAEVDVNTHDFSVLISTEKAATCIDKGLATFGCSRCEQTQQRATDPDPNAHLPGPVISSVAPDCTTDGYTICHCTRCNSDVRVDQPKLGHDVHSTVVKPGYKTRGCTHDACSRCDYTLDHDATPALGHSYDKTVVAPGCTHQGYTKRICRRCSYSYTSNVLAALGHSWSATASDGRKHCLRAGCTATLLVDANETQLDTQINSNNLTSDSVQAVLDENTGNAVVFVDGGSLESGVDVSCNGVEIDRLIVGGQVDGGGFNLTLSSGFQSEKLGVRVAENPDGSYVLALYENDRQLVITGASCINGEVTLTTDTGGSCTFRSDLSDYRIDESTLGAGVNTICFVKRKKIEITIVTKQITPSATPAPVNIIFTYKTIDSGSKTETAEPTPDAAPTATAPSIVITPFIDAGSLENAGSESAGDDIKIERFEEAVTPSPTPVPTPAPTAQVITKAHQFLDEPARTATEPNCKHKWVKVDGKYHECKKCGWRAAHNYASLATIFSFGIVKKCAGCGYKK